MTALARLTKQENALCNEHWARLCAQARAAGCSPHDAEDAVQELFEKMVRRGHLCAFEALSQAHQSARLSVMLRNHLINRWRDSHRIKRGGRCTTVPLERPDGTTHDAPSWITPATNHDRAWIESIVARALETLQFEERLAVWECIECWLNGHEIGPREGSVRVAVHRAKARLRQLVEKETAGVKVGELLSMY